MHHSETRREIGDVLIDAKGDKWVVVLTYGRGLYSAVRVNSMAHRIHAEGSEAVAKSLSHNEGLYGPAATSEDSSRTA